MYKPKFIVAAMTDSEQKEIKKEIREELEELGTIIESCISVRLRKNGSNPMNSDEIESISLEFISEDGQKYTIQLDGVAPDPVVWSVMGYGKPSVFKNMLDAFTTKKAICNLMVLDEVSQKAFNESIDCELNQCSSLSDVIDVALDLCNKFPFTGKLHPNQSTYQFGNFSGKTDRDDFKQRYMKQVFEKKKNYDVLCVRFTIKIA